MRTIDLNADLGEECGDDEAMLRIVTSASVAAGGHAGGGRVLRQTVSRAAELRVAVGAHPSYVDREAFGRVSRAADHDAVSLQWALAAQIDAVDAACREAGVPLAYVKAHGALYADAAEVPFVADAMVRAVTHAAGGRALAVLGMPGSHLESACDAAGVPFIAEAFADRGYTADGRLVPRSEPGAVLTDPDEIAARVIGLVVHGSVPSVAGDIVALRPDTICVHGDTPGAVGIARAVRAALERQGVPVAAWSTRP